MLVGRSPLIFADLPFPDKHRRKVAAADEGGDSTSANLPSIDDGKRPPQSKYGQSIFYDCAADLSPTVTAAEKQDLMKPDAESNTEDDRKYSLCELSC